MLPFLSEIHVGIYKFEQTPSVLGGGGASLVVQSRLHLQAKLELDIVCCALPVRFRTWADIPATSQTLVGPTIKPL